MHLHGSRSKPLESFYPIWNVRHTQPAFDACHLHTYMCGDVHDDKFIFRLLRMHLCSFHQDQLSIVDKIKWNEEKKASGKIVCSTNYHYTHPKGIFILSNIHKLKSFYALHIFTSVCVSSDGACVVTLFILFSFMFLLARYERRNCRRSTKWTLKMAASKQHFSQPMSLGKSCVCVYRRRWRWRRRQLVFQVRTNGRIFPIQNKKNAETHVHIRHKNHIRMRLWPAHLLRHILCIVTNMKRSSGVWVKPICGMILFYY